MLQPPQLASDLQHAVEDAAAHLYVWALKDIPQDLRDALAAARERETSVPGRRVLVLLPDLPDLGTEILMRSHRANLLFMGDPKADGFIEASAWTGKLAAELGALRPGRTLLTDAAGLRLARELRGLPASVPLEHPLGQLNPQIEWILQRLGRRFTLQAIAREPSGLVVARLAGRR